MLAFASFQFALLALPIGMAWGLLPRKREEGDLRCALRSFRLASNRVLRQHCP
jgi:hypothetical protein